MKEIFLIYLWENKLYNHELTTTDGQHVEILHPGMKNSDAGPDFLHARLRIDDTVWAGNIEMHLNASDWYQHRHHVDKNYDNVILHVVYQADKTTFSSSRQAIPILEVKNQFDTSILLRYRSFIDSKKWIACENRTHQIQRFTWLAWLDRLTVERLEMKTDEVMLVFENTSSDWEETFYRMLLINFGFKVNQIPSEQLGRLLPFHLLLKHSDQVLQLEAMLFGVAGMLDTGFTDPYPCALKKEFAFLKNKYGLQTMKYEQWRFMRMRPANFPTIRLSQFAAIIHKNGRIFSKILAAGNIDQIGAFLNVSASEYWNNHFRFESPSTGKIKKLGIEAINLILINTVVHVMFAYGMHHNNAIFKDKAMMLLETTEAENNEVLRKYQQIGVHASNALQSQALLHLKKHYCNPKRCLQCRIGHVIIQSADVTE